MTICMTNGGMYTNVKIINGIDIKELDSIKIRNIVNKNDFIDIECQYSYNSVLRTDCISSINFD
jgi:hypothetical protein